MGPPDAMALPASTSTTHAADRIDEARETVPTTGHRPLPRDVAPSTLAGGLAELETVVKHGHRAVGVGLDAFISRNDQEVKEGSSSLDEEVDETFEVLLYHYKTICARATPRGRYVDVPCICPARERLMLAWQCDICRRAFDLVCARARVLRRHAL